MYFTGSRTGMVATTLFLIVYFFIEFRGVTRFFLVSTMFIGSLFLMQSDALLEKVYDTTFELSKSEENAKYEDKEITQSNISSGRTDIYQYYLDEVSFSNFLQGNGIAYFNTIKKFDIRLHNDFLEFFFSFGLIGFCCFIYFIIYKLFISTIISKQGVEKQFLIGLLVFFIGLSLFTSIMDYQNIIYFYFTLIIAMKTNEYLTQKEI
jgi:O-antigen ligase